VTTAPWPRIEFAQRSDPGRDPDKQVNEDSCGYQQTPLGHLLVVCDGMGGHAAGQEASQLAIATIVSTMANTSADAHPGESLQAAIALAGQRVYSFGGEGKFASRPGSTCVAILVHPGGTDVCHVGDSRVYVVREGQLWPLTRDHSMVQQMVDAGILSPEEAIGHPDGNKITRALGMVANVKVELREDRVIHQKGDVFLLMTDGVTDVVQDGDLLALAKRELHYGNVNTLCEKIVELANARGGPDNITIQAALIQDPGLRPESVQAQRSIQRTVPEKPYGANPTAAGVSATAKTEQNPTYGAPGGPNPGGGVSPTIPQVPPFDDSPTLPKGFGTGAIPQASPGGPGGMEGIPNLAGMQSGATVRMILPGHVREHLGTAKPSDVPLGQPNLAGVAALAQAGSPAQYPGAGTPAAGPSPGTAPASPLGILGSPTGNMGGNGMQEAPAQAAAMAPPAQGHQSQTIAKSSKPKLMIVGAVFSVIGLITCVISLYFLFAKDKLREQIQKLRLHV
jgi:PPM family protein phosphatase